jgi:signal transduction histidine kinase
MVIQGIDEGRQFDLSGPVLSVGRDASNSVHLHDTEVSRKHAEFRATLDGSGYHVVDRGSANGIYVNGQKVADALLHSGDQVQIGQTVFVYSLGRDERMADGLADRIRMIGDPLRGYPADAELSSQIVGTIGESEGSRILSAPEDAQSPWLRTRLANLAILYEASQAVSHILDLNQLLDRILELTFRSIEADRGCVLLLNAESGAVEPKAARWRNPAPGGSEPMAVSRTITDNVLRQRQGIIVSDAARDERFAPGKSIIDIGIREAICVPMKGRHETLGVLYLDTITRRTGGIAARNASDNVPGKPKFTEDHLALAIALAHQAALAIEETRYYHAMVQAERLAAVGQTIAALSHHIKNILQGLRSGTDVLRMGAESSDVEMLRQGWKIVEKNQGKIYDLVWDMLSYSKPREPDVEPTDLNELIGDVVELMKPRAAEMGVSLQTSVTAGLAAVPVDAEAVNRVVLNLVTNALDAVEGRPSPLVRVATEWEGDGRCVLITVADNGVGIEPDRLNDVFKPFFSTKGSRGTGLGLAVSRKSVREHGGDILVTSIPERGSTFTIRLPLRTARPEETGLPPEAPAVDS